MGVPVETKKLEQINVKIADVGGSVIQFKALLA